jgi:hypothetical protein
VLSEVEVVAVAEAAVAVAVDGAEEVGEVPLAASDQDPANPAGSDL